MHAAIDVSFGMVNNFMHVAPFQFVVGYGVIGEYGRSEFHIVENFILQSLAFHIRHNGCANLAFVAVKHSHDDSFSGCAASVTALGCKAFAAIPVHVLQLSTDESFVNFHAAAFCSAELRSYIASLESESK